MFCNCGVEACLVPRGSSVLQSSSSRRMLDMALGGSELMCPSGAG